MLQWMGGSRKKVNTSRKSTLNRQKQYFEQRRRQQQHQQQTNEIESNAYGTRTAVKHDKGNQSLDILSLLNLSKACQEQNSSCPNGREDIEVSASGGKYDLSGDPQTISSKIGAPLTSVKYNKARPESGFQLGVASPKRPIATAPDTHNTSFIETYSNPHNSRRPVEQQSSLLDFFSNDGLEDNYAEGIPGPEAHVAFSVKVWEKWEWKHPYIHHNKLEVIKPEVVANQIPDFSIEVVLVFNNMSSPISWTFSYECVSPFQGAKKVNSFKNLKLLDDFDIEMDSEMQHVRSPLTSNGLDFSVDFMESFSNPKNKFSASRTGSQHDGRVSKFETYYGGGKVFDETESSLKCRWGGRSDLLEEDSFSEWEHDSSRKRPSEVNHRYVNDMMHDKYGMSDLTFEEPFSPKRFCPSIRDKFNILESPTYSKHQALENLDFLISKGQRQHTGGRNFCFKGVESRPDWSCLMTEDDKDSTSLLSEESCSSSAENIAREDMPIPKSVRVAATDCSLPSSTRKHSKRRHAYTDPKYKYHVEITTMEGADHAEASSLLKSSDKFHNVVEEKVES